jgi:CSLREA domain-containing protein
VPLVGQLFTVNSLGDGDDANLSDGRCETATAGECTLRAAIEEINHDNNSADSIGFNIPTAQPWTIPLTKPLPVTSGMRIIGPGANTLFVSHPSPNSSLDTPFSIFNVTATGTVNISNLTIGGLGAFGSTNPGTGLQNSAGTVNITGCTISYNINTTFNASGGAINNGAGTVQITNSNIEFNEIGGSGAPTQTLGGGVYNGTGTITVVNSTFNHNNADHGGGIFNSSGVVTVTSSTFHDNGASYDGGGISNFGGTVNVTNSTFYANVAHSKDSRSVTGAFGSGGGIFNTNYGPNIGTLNLSNSTVTANFSADLGGGVENRGTANVKSTIIALNYGGIGFIGQNGAATIIGASPDVHGAFNSHDFNLIGRKDASTGLTGGTDKKGTIASPLDPKLDPKGLRNNGGPTQTVALMTGSPAIDKGTSASLIGTLTTDQRGNRRTFDNTSVTNASGGDGTDIGAFERQTQ